MAQQLLILSTIFNATYDITVLNQQYLLWITLIITRGFQCFTILQSSF